MKVRGIKTWPKFDFPVCTLRGDAMLCVDLFYLCHLAL